MVADTNGFDRIADERSGPVIHVRWVETLGDVRRAMLERALGLYRGEHTDGTTWRYRVPDASPDRLRAIVAHDMVADTSGFDRGSLELDAPEGDVARLAAQPLVYSGRLAPARVGRRGARLDVALDPTDRRTVVCEPECRLGVLPRLRRPAEHLCRRAAVGHGQHRRPGAAVVRGRFDRAASSSRSSPTAVLGTGTGSRFRSPWTRRSYRQTCHREDATTANWGFRSTMRSSFYADPRSS